MNHIKQPDRIPGAEEQTSLPSAIEQKDILKEYIKDIKSNILATRQEDGYLPDAPWSEDDDGTTLAAVNKLKTTIDEKLAKNNLNNYHDLLSDLQELSDTARTIDFPRDKLEAKIYQLAEKIKKPPKKQDLNTAYGQVSDHYTQQQVDLDNIDV